MRISVMELPGGFALAGTCVLEGQFAARAGDRPGLTDRVGSVRGFPEDAAIALDIPTCITRGTCGCRKIHEFGPLLDVATTRISLKDSKLAGAPTTRNAPTL